MRKLLLCSKCGRDRYPATAHACESAVLFGLRGAYYLRQTLLCVSERAVACDDCVRYAVIIYVERPFAACRRFYACTGASGSLCCRIRVLSCVWHA